MVTIIKGTENAVDLTLNDKVTISAPVYFLFRLIRDVAFSAPSQTFLCTDETDRQIERYNRFLITEGDIEDLNNGIIALASGQYTLEVYAQHSSTNLDYTLADEKIFSDLCQVIPSATVINETYTPNISVTV